MTRDEIALKVDDLAVVFDTEEGRRHAVDRVGFTLKRGATLGIVGESGCGKSVTSLAVMRLLPQPSGKIVNGCIMFDNEDLLALSPREMTRIRGRRISIIFQEPMTALNPVHRIGRQIDEVYRLHFPAMTGKEMAQSAVQMLDRVGIGIPEKVLRLYPHQLSGGMRQRVMIAIALASSPDILIADEPTTALDVTVQAQILELIKEIQKSDGMSVILITHDLGVIAENCDEAVVMYAGRVAEKADVAGLFENPVHPYTRGLLKSIPSLESRRKAALPTIKGNVPSLENMPAGCRFNTRCPHRMDICTAEVPLEKAVLPGHAAACHLVEAAG